MPKPYSRVKRESKPGPLVAESADAEPRLPEWRPSDIVHRRLWKVYRSAMLASVLGYLRRSAR